MRAQADGNHLGSLDWLLPEAARRWVTYQLRSIIHQDIHAAVLCFHALEQCGHSSVVFVIHNDSNSSPSGRCDKIGGLVERVTMRRVDIRHTAARHIGGRLFHTQSDGYASPCAAPCSGLYCDQVLLLSSLTTLL